VVSHEWGRVEGREGVAGVVGGGDTNRPGSVVLHRHSGELRSTREKSACAVDGSEEIKRRHEKEE